MYPVGDPSYSLIDAYEEFIQSNSAVVDYPIIGAYSMSEAPSLALQEREVMTLNADSHFESVPQVQYIIPNYFPQYASQPGYSEQAQGVREFPMQSAYAQQTPIYNEPHAELSFERHRHTKRPREHHQSEQIVRKCPRLESSSPHPEFLIDFGLLSEHSCLKRFPERFIRYFMQLKSHAEIKAVLNIFSVLYSSTAEERGHIFPEIILYLLRISPISRIELSLILGYEEASTVRYVRLAKAQCPYLISTRGKLNHAFYVRTDHLYDMRLLEEDHKFQVDPEAKYVQYR